MRLFPSVIRLCWASLWLCGGLVPLSAEAATLYVSPSGDDTGNCQNGRPCRTIARAASLTVPGDLVEIAPGMYPERVNVTRSGNASAWITYRGHNGSGCPATPLNDIHSRGVRPNPPVASWGFNVRADYLRFECLRMVSGPSDLVVQSGDNRSGVYIHTGRHDVAVTDNVMDASSRNDSMAAGVGFGPLANTLPYNILVARNYVYRTAYGFLIYCGTNCLYEENEVEDLLSITGGADLDYTRVFGRGVTLRRNYFHGNSVLNCNGCHVDCFQTWNLNLNANEIAQNIVIEGNTCFNAHQGIILRDTTSATPGVYASHFNWTVTNNIFAYGPTGSSMAWCALFEHTGNVIFRHNLCYGTGQVGYLNGTTGTHEYNLHLRQANPYNANAIPVNWKAGSITAKYNLLHTPDRTFASSTYPNDYVNIDPLLANAPASDFRPTPGSPLVDRALGSTVPTDRNGVSRPQGNAPDIGPYELVSARYFNFGVQREYLRNQASQAPPPDLLHWDLEGGAAEPNSGSVQVLPNACVLTSATVLAEEPSSVRLVVERLVEDNENGESEWRQVSSHFGLAEASAYGDTALSEWDTYVPAGASLRVRVVGGEEGRSFAPLRATLRCDEKLAEDRHATSRSLKP